MKARLGTDPGSGGGVVPRRATPSHGHGAAAGRGDPRGQTGRGQQASPRSVNCVHRRNCARKKLASGSKEPGLSKLGGRGGTNRRHRAVADGRFIDSCRGGHARSFVSPRHACRIRLSSVPGATSSPRALREMQHMGGACCRGPPQLVRSLER